MNSITKVVSTKQFAGDDAVSTELTIDLSNLTEADVLEYAVQTLVIRWQGSARKAKSIPATATYTAPKPGTKGTGIITRTALLNKLFGAKAPALIAKYGDVDKAYEAVKAFIDDDTDDPNTTE
uniref:Tail assembly chaperone n=1 Tax=viral metagenome TaxID=1070528 RepID=A0A6M3JB08_9ZZZZ